MAGLKVFLFVVLLLCGAWQMDLGVWIHAKAILAHFLLKTAWTAMLNGHKEVKPWPWADTWVIARLIVPHLGI